MPPLFLLSINVFSLLRPFVPTLSYPAENICTQPEFYSGPHVKVVVGIGSSLGFS